MSKHSVHLKTSPTDREVWEQLLAELSSHLMSAEMRINAQFRIILSSTTPGDATLSSPESRFLYFDFHTAQKLFEELLQPGAGLPL